MRGRNLLSEKKAKKTKKVETEKTHRDRGAKEKERSRRRRRRNERRFAKWIFTIYNSVRARGQRVTSSRMRKSRLMNEKRIRTHDGENR